MQEPAVKRVVAFIDGQNLFYTAKAAGFCTTPDYDVYFLAHEVCRRQGWTCQAVRFYTGLPDSKISPRVFHAWQSKLARMKASGIETVTRPIRYSGTPPVGREKGIDVRLALDIVRLGRQNVFDVGLIVSQDQDIHEVVHELRDIAAVQSRWIKLASTFLVRPDGQNQRGIYDTDWIPIDRSLYDSAREPTPFY